jgi:hypothetical protein
MHDTHLAMQEWLYRASNAKADLEATRGLVDRFGFIHRSAFADTTKKQMIANVAKVGVGDIIHMFFVDDSGGRPLGTYRVVAPFRHPTGSLFAAAVPKTTLRRVVDPELREQLKDAGYEPDPQIGEFCGWPVIADEEDHRSPSYLAALFPGRNALVPR